MLTTGFARADAIASLLVVVLMLKAGYGLVRDSGRIFLEAAPAGLDPDVLGDRLAAQKAVVEVHDLHIWQITSGQPALSAHVLVQPGGDCHAVRRGLQGDAPVGEQAALVAPVDLGLRARQRLEALHRVLVPRREFGHDPRPGLGDVHLDPLVMAGEAVLGGQPLVDDRRLQPRLAPQPGVHHAGELLDHPRLGAGRSGKQNPAREAERGHRRRCPQRIKDGAIPEQVAAELGVSRSMLYRELGKHREDAAAAPIGQEG